MQIIFFIFVQLKQSFMPYPPAKVNIGLSVVGKRPDGFHHIETVFYPIPLCDTLTVEAAGSDCLCQLVFSCFGLELPENGVHHNLCCKAYYLLNADYHLPPSKIILNKAIPVGAGLGGGSSDAAYTLKELKRVFQLKISDRELIRYAQQLGSDCAFFLYGKPAFGTGKGDLLEPFSLSLEGYGFLLVKPHVFVSTADAYSLITPKKKKHHLPEALQAPVSEWRYTVFNDFESPVFKKFPEIGRIKQQLYEKGALYASMSGSGSSVYGIFEKKPDGIEKLFPDCFIWSCVL